MFGLANFLLIIGAHYVVTHISIWLYRVGAFQRFALDILGEFFGALLEGIFKIIGECLCGMLN